MTWLDAAKVEAGKAEERLKESETLWALAVEAYRRDDSKVNRITMQAARRLVREAKAQYGEWIL